MFDLYKNDNTQVSKPELQKNLQPEKTTLGGQNKMATDSKYVGEGGGRIMERAGTKRMCV